MRAQDKEIQQYRELMEVPDRFEGGFGFKTVVGALFLGFLMVPGSIYLSLFMGATLGPAAQWVTVILFAEVGGETVGWFSGIANLNEALQHANGLRYSWDYVKLWWAMRHQPACLAVKSVLAFA